MKRGSVTHFVLHVDGDDDDGDGDDDTHSDDGDNA